MSEVIGKNTPNSVLLQSFIDRLEANDAAKKALKEDRDVIVAEAKAAGFSMKNGIDYVMKMRKMKPNARQEAETTRDIYMHAAGLDAEPPLFRQLGVMASDGVSKEKLIEAFKLLVPPNGEIILKVGGRPMRFWRDKDGDPQAAEYDPPTIVDNVRSGVAPRPAQKDVPVCTALEADAMGEAAAKANVPVIENPFPFGHEHRPRWDEGWRRGAGNNGMGGNVAQFPGART